MIKRPPETIPTMIAMRLVAVREARGFKTTTAAAEASGVSNSSLARYEAAERYPSLESILKLSRTYDCSLDYLCRGITGCLDDDLRAKLDLRED